MPNGEKAKSPDTPYYVYEYSFNGRVFYVGHTYHQQRSHGRWTYVRNLLKLEKAGKITPGKLSDLNLPNNRVIAAMIEAGEHEYVVTTCRPCMGKKQSIIEEAEQIKKRLSEGCVLSNVENNPTPATVAEVLMYLDLRD